MRLGVSRRPDSGEDQAVLAREASDKAGRRLAHLKKAADSQRPVVTRGGTSSLVRAAPASLDLAGTIKVRSARQKRLTEAWSVGNRMVKNWLTGLLW